MTRRWEGLLVAALGGGLGTIGSALEKALHDGGAPDYTRLAIAFMLGATIGVSAWLRTPPDSVHGSGTRGTGAGTAGTAADRAAPAPLERIP